MLETAFLFFSIFETLFLPNGPIVEGAATGGAGNTYIVTLELAPGENVLRLHCFPGGAQRGAVFDAPDQVSEIASGIVFSVSDIGSIRTSAGTLDHYVSWIGEVEGQTGYDLFIGAWREGGDCEIQRTWTADVQGGYFGTELTPVDFPVAGPSANGTTGLVVSGSAAAAGLVPLFYNQPGAPFEDQFWTTGGIAFDDGSYRDVTLGGAAPTLTGLPARFPLIGAADGEVPEPRSGPFVVTGTRLDDCDLFAEIWTLPADGVGPGERLLEERLLDFDCPPASTLQFGSEAVARFDPFEQRLRYTRWALQDRQLTFYDWTYGLPGFEPSRESLERGQTFSLGQFSGLPNLERVFPIDDNAVLLTDPFDGRRAVIVPPTDEISLVDFFRQGEPVAQGRAGDRSQAMSTWDQTGPTDIWKLEDTHVFNSNFYLTGLASYVGGGFELSPRGGRDDAFVSFDTWRDTYQESERVPTFGGLDGCRTYAAGAPPGQRTPDSPLAAGGLCLDDGNVSAWANFLDSEGRPSVASSFPITLDTGAFTFFDESNVEVVVKVIDGCPINGKRWVFAAGATTQPVDLVVQFNDTNQLAVYSNPPGPFALIRDVEAADCPELILESRARGLLPDLAARALERPLSALDWTLRMAEEEMAGEEEVREARGAGGSCQPSVGTLCLNDGRFRVTATYETGSGQSGAAAQVPLTAESGYFWFFDAANVEVLVKVLDACGVNQRYWLFATGLSDVRVDLTVEDTQTGVSESYRNPLGSPFDVIADTGTFPCS